MAFDPSLFEANRRGLSRQYGATAAMNAYRKFLSQRRGERSLEEYERGVERQIPKLTSNIAQRGLYGQGVRSGIYNRALTDFGTEAVRQRGYLAEDIAGEQQGFDIQQRQLLAELESQLGDLETQKARQIAADAAALLQLR